jgi:hypothetical protein
MLELEPASHAMITHVPDYSSVRRTLIDWASTMRHGPMPTHLVLERSPIKLLSQGHPEGRYRPPVKLGMVGLIAVPGAYWMPRTLPEQGKHRPEPTHLLL